ncbi:MAG: NADH:ubiquinone oxidoreductase [Oscillatoriales cyanobacterium]|nr:MAG: NADH:ubiquinone oxidoreductase [Oscillatoriales cyanobacterium]
MKPWAFDRLVSTLRYFGAFPIVGDWGWVQQWLGTRAVVNWSDPTLLDAMPPIAVVFGACGEVGRRVTRSLLDQGWRVWAVGADQARLPTNPNLIWLGQDWAAAPFDRAQAIVACEAVGGSIEPVIDRAAQLNRDRATESPILFDFRQPDADLGQVWGAIDDVVMGGVSSSNFRLLHGSALFAGQVSTENSGGFASVRTRNFDRPLNLAAFEGIELRLKGDGQRYKLILRGESRWDGVGYCASFDTVYNIWQTVRIPFRQLQAVFRARTLPEAPEFDASSLQAMQLMLSKFEYDGALNPRFQAGAFSLELETIRVYGDRPRLTFVLCGGLPETADYLQGSGLRQVVAPSSTTTNTTTNEPIDPARAASLAQDCLRAIGARAGQEAD